MYRQARYEDRSIFELNGEADFCLTGRHAVPNMDLPEGMSPDRELACRTCRSGRW